MPRGARLVRKSSNRSKKIPLNPPFSKGEVTGDSPFLEGEVTGDSPFLEGEVWGDSPFLEGEVWGDSPCSKGDAWAASPFSEGEAFELPPWPPCSASRGGPVRKELDMVAHPDGMRHRWKRGAGEDFTEPVPFIDHLELRRGPLLLMRGLEGHCERSEAISMASRDCFVAGAPRNDGWMLFLSSITPPPGGVCCTQLPVLRSAGAWMNPFAQGRIMTETRGQLKKKTAGADSMNG